jgi:UDP-N-acetylmuramoyl-L-alanyl-D-glutamate--2,6-diaminopimelate ligase
MSGALSAMTRTAETRRSKNLRDLLAGFAVGPPDVQITDLALDSRAVQPGAAFIALPGLRTHGVRFAAQAVQAGARAVLWEPAAGVAPPPLPAHARLIAAPALTANLGAIADRFFDAPSQALRVLGVTGTNGKTTTAHLIAAALQHLGEPAAYAGTLGVGRLDALRAATHTTPDCITVHRQLAELRDDGVRFLGMEVTSHALEQHRVDAVRFAAAVFTNLTRDHLDYHGSFAAYAQAKSKLFAWPDLNHAVLNVQDEFGCELASRTSAAAMTLYARSQSAIQQARAPRPSDQALYAARVSSTPRGLTIDLDGGFGRAALRSRFFGDFNVDNVLAALAALLGLGVALPDAVAALEQCDAPPGRMETLSAPGKPLAVIDYAHTPDALEKALLAVRAHCTGKLTCVFGCGGERDRGKRPLMAAIAERLADRVVVTDDNPRNEDGDAIVADIVAGLSVPERALIERDRAAAIERALRDSEAADAVLIAGKGHEDYQIVGHERRSFSDRKVAQAAWTRAP